MIISMEIDVFLFVICPEGGNGNDIIYGGGGSNIMFGQNGRDTVSQCIQTSLLVG